MIINQLALASIPMFNAEVPAEGPRCIVVAVQFDGAGLNTLDLSMLTDQNRISMLQSIFIDNSGSDNAFTVEHSSIGIPLIVKGRTQGYYPFVCPNPARLIFTGTPSSTANVILLNVPVAPAQWSTQ